MKYLFFLLSSVYLLICLPCHAQSSDLFNEKQVIFHARNYDLSPDVLKLALKAYRYAQETGQTKQNLLTIVDYSLPSTERRLWVLDMEREKVLFHTLVAHGKNSGQLMATHFSNRLNTLKSSLGTLLTGQTYRGKHDYSLSLHGLEKGINDNAANRHIVLHSANYVSEEFIEKHGHLGTSWGCLAVNPNVNRAIIDTIKNGSVVFIYYPDKTWLKHSTFLS